MPPMLPICMSTMTRSGDSSATNATTSGPEVTARTSTSGPLMTASISLRRVGASLATRMVCTDGTLSDPPAGRKPTSCRGQAAGAALGPSGEEVVGRPLQPDQLVHVLSEEGDPSDRCGRHLRRQAGERRFLPGRHRVERGQVRLQAASSGAPPALGVPRSPPSRRRARSG